MSLLTRVLVDDLDRVDVARYEGAAGVMDPVHMISDMALHAIVSPGEGRLGTWERIHHSRCGRGSGNLRKPVDD